MKGKVIVIAGASSGIGASLAELLGSRGASLVLTARREAVLRHVAARSGVNVLFVPADMTRREEVQRVVAAALDRFGRIDVWINNVGRGISRQPSELTDDDLDEMMRINVKSAFYGMQEVLPHFKRRGEGHIINMSSLLGRVPFALVRSAYSASKHFLNALTANFRTEVQATHPGIQISVVSPGVVATEFGLNALHGGIDSRSFSYAQSPDEVAEVIASVIETRHADVYTRPEAREMIASYYADLGTH
jgi:short-subunit dehydrogenase